MTNQPLHCGIDIGSTTIKMVVLDEKKDKVLFSDYQRHHANISNALTEILKKALSVVGDQPIAVCVTGSAGMGVSERYGLQFAQEVIAATDYITNKHSEIQTLIDIGGEDTKMVFLKAGSIPDIRMNGSCAGGTGAFIDQMATILAVDIAEMSRQALAAGKIYPIASRCGVFSKTDVQNLIARNVSIADISASVFHAVALQTITSLSRGTEPLPKIFFCGGPLAFIPALRQAFVNYLKLKDEDYIISENAALIPAFGCALTEKPEDKTTLLSSLIEKINVIDKQPQGITKGRLNKLFDNQAELEQWIAKKQNHRLESITLEKLEGNECYIGIDSGSTTTKIVAINEKEQIIYQFYSRNKGNPLKTISEGLSEFLTLANSAKKDIHIVASSVTGYGEDLVKAAYNMDHGIVETIAHYSAAQKFNPKVSFILDIGGQDMKAIFVENGAINRLEINEACSSGCGSFIEGFAKSLNYTAANFAALACNAQAPCDLGTRCTVFMNSKVKQFLREGATVADISAGLAYSVVKNCLYKVLKIKDISELGNNIVVQGGTMRNHAVVRALELLTGKEVIFSDVPELMGAYGAALYACRMHKNENIHNVRTLKEVASLNAYQSEQFYCSGCENNCIINKYTFHNGNSYFSGNKCEKIYSNKGQDFVKGENHYNFKYNKIVAQKKVETANPIVIGIPRILNMYENMQFWLTLFNECGIKTVLSGRSTFTLYEKGLPYVMSDNICFPAKLVHGHIIDLIDKKANRIFMPYVVYESKEDKNTPNSFNCPIVSGYSDVIKSSMPFLEKHNISIDAPTIAFNNEQLLTKACIKYLMTLGIEKSLVEKALPKALAAQRIYVSSLQENCQRIVEKNAVENNMVIMLVGRPYHADPLIQHKISDMISAFGVDVISEDFVRSDEHNTFDNVQTIMQWAYTNRILKAAEWVAKTNANVHLVQMTSFGCGPDAFIIDEVNEVLKRHGKSHTILKIDDVNNIGSLRLRIRSLIESLRFASDKEIVISPLVKNKIFTEDDKHRTILVPFFSEYYSPFVPVLFKLAGFNFVTLPPSDVNSSELGLKFANNEVCYPATLVIGDIIKALQTGKYNRDEIAIGITQTGGQCRATNYLSLIKKAMVTAGYEDIPVISIASGDSLLNPQPGFDVKWRKALTITAVSMLYADCISKMYYATVVRQKVQGGAIALRDKYINAALPFAEKKDIRGMLKLLKQAAVEFNSMCTDKEFVPRIGIVGEIYVKYNAFGNKNVVNWLIEQNVEVVMPSLANFFLQYFANYKINVAKHLEKPGLPQWIVDILFALVDRYIKKVENAAKDFKYYRPFTNIYTDAEKAEEIVNTAAQFGEGWLIPAEIANFAEENVNYVVSLQPFGCIANHVVAKGIERKLKHRFPDMNMLFLDFDSGVSDVNILNRLHFIIKGAEQQAEKEAAKATV